MGQKQEAVAIFDSIIPYFRTTGNHQSLAISLNKAGQAAVDGAKKAAEDQANAAVDDAKQKANDAIDKGADKLKKGLGL
jgi:ArsR family metal-binding transcriptional regulator